MVWCKLVKQTKKCRENTFRSVTDLSSGGEKTNGLDAVDLVLVLSLFHYVF